MRAINPLYIGLLFVSILAISIFSLNSAKSDLSDAKESFSKTLKIANELSGLKKAYANKTFSQKSLQKILAQRVLKEVQLDAKFKKNSVFLQSKEIDKKALNFLMSKILNGTYNVTSMKIKKLSESKASFEMEIKW